MAAPDSSFLTSYVIEPVGWMLVHSVWQLACLAAILALLVRLLQGHSAQLRYALSALALMAMVTAPVVTFWRALPVIEPDGPIVSAADQQQLDQLAQDELSHQPFHWHDPQQSAERPSPAVVPKLEPAAGPAALPTPRTWLQSALPWLVSLWVMGVVGLSIWNIGGWIAVQRLVHIGTRPVSESLQAAAQRLARRVGLSRVVHLVQSAVVDVPSVVGWLRPTILLPGCILTGLNPDQLEAIIAHELAHIRRSDYLANLLQTVAETLLFYHPGVWFVSRRMRIEREYCADRLAVEVLGDATAYANALATLEEQAQATPQFALGATGGSLVQRVRRILGLSTQDVGRTGSWLVGAAASLTALLVLFASPSIHAAVSRGDAPRLSVRRVWADDTTDTSGRVSPDGRHIAYIDWDSGDLGVHDLQQGVSRPLTNDGTWEDPNRWAEAPVWSPDSKQLAYICFQDGMPPQLRTLSLDDGPPQTLYTPKAGGFVYTADWTPDGGHILVGLRDAGQQRRMALINAATGSVLHLRDLHMSDGGPEAVSPDGRFVAFTQGSGQTERRDIFLHELATGQSRPIVEHPANDDCPLWSPDGRWLTFLSDRTGRMATWAARVEDGLAQGSVQQMFPLLGFGSPMGVSQRGEYFFGRGSSGDVFAVDYHVLLQQARGDPRPLVRRFEGQNGRPAWSPDGKKLAFLSRRPAPDGATRSMVVVRDEATGREKTNDVYLRRYHHVAWLPDGELLIRAATDSGEHVIYCWNLDRDTTIPVVTWPRATKGRVSSTFVVSRDGSALFYGTVGDGTARIFRRMLEGGQEQAIAARPAMSNGGLSLSPGGKVLAWVGHSSIWVVDLDSGALRPLLELDNKKNQSVRRGITWTPDGQYLIFSMAGGDPQWPRASSLWRIAAEGGEPQPLGVTRQRIEHLDMHPDGKQLAFSTGGGAHGEEVWAFKSSLLVPEE